ncbi:LuxR C-terminal-related transcriptional regulator [Ensifer sp. ENS06]|uniref:helix-turn-helix transcriptional regulator n=1 Tax=Ensifer sp. ENS06 TaxID=2769276 RepID=UPI0035C85977
MNVKGTAKSATRIANSRLWEAVGAASAALGECAFYDRLLDVLGAVVGYDARGMVRYSRHAAPDLIIPRQDRADIEVPYNSGLFEFDPFHRYWRSDARPGVKSLRLLVDASFWESAYGSTFLRAARVSDELAIFLPALGETSTTLILDRAKGRFLTTELAQAEAIFPLLEGLHNAHIRATVNRGRVAGSAEKPLRIVDRCGRELATNQAWKAFFQSKRHNEHGEAPSTCATQLVLGDGRILTRHSLPADFGLAPGGFVDVVEEPAPPASEASAADWLTPLTQREREIVKLTLEGYPIAGIAKRLGVGRGTIKNHRVRLYQKLDITTERELFLVHMRYVHAQGAINTLARSTKRNLGTLGEGEASAAATFGRGPFLYLTGPA